MRGHFREAHDMRVQVEDDSEEPLPEFGSDEFHQDDRLSPQDDTMSPQDDNMSPQYETINDQVDVDSKPIQGAPDTDEKLKTILYENQVFTDYQSFQKTLNWYQDEAKITFIVRVVIQSIPGTCPQNFPQFSYLSIWLLTEKISGKNYQPNQKVLEITWKVPLLQYRVAMTVE